MATQKQMGWVRKALLKMSLKGLTKDVVQKALTGQDFREFFDTEHAAGSIWKVPTINEQEKLYRTREIVYACIRYIVYCFPDARPEVGSVTVKGFKALDSHPMVELVRNPNPDMDYAIYNWFHLAHWMATGRSFQWIWRTRGREIAELWPMPSSWVEVVGVDTVTQRKRMVEKYIVRIPNTSQQFDVQPEDMIYNRFPDPSNFLGAIGPLEAAVRSLQLDDGRENYMVEMLENTTLPGLILHQAAEFTPQQANDIRAVLRDKIGKGKRGSPLLLSGEGAGAEMPTPLSDLDWPGLSNLSETRICAVLGVPATLVGLRSGLQTTGLSGQDVASAESIFYRGTMRALWNANASALTRALLRNDEQDEDIKLEFRYNTTDVKAMQPDLQEMASMAAQLSGTGLIYVNEGRKMVGLPEDPKREGKVLMPMGVQEVVPGETPPTPPTPGAGLPFGKPAASGTMGEEEEEAPETGGEGEGEGEGEVPAESKDLDIDTATLEELVEKGNANSGNRGHVGRPGFRGGSGPSKVGTGKLRQLPLFAPERAGGGAHFVAPPTPQGKRAGTGQSHGTGHKDVTKTKLGDMAERIMERMGARPLHPGKRTGRMDVAIGNTAFELKARTVESVGYKAGPKKSEVAGKKQWCRQNKMESGIMLMIIDRKNNTAYAYARPGIKAYRLTDNPKNQAEWYFMGKARMA